MKEAVKTKEKAKKKEVVVEKKTAKCECDSTCKCGCQEGKECTCTCGCDSDCKCGCQEGKECTCGCGCGCCCCGCKCGCCCKNCKCKCCKKSMFDCYVEVIENYINFCGRLSRRGYWSFFLMNILLFIAVVFVDAIVGGSGFVTVTYILLMTIPSISAIIRRLHDTGRNMTWFIVSIFVLPLYVITTNNFILSIPDGLSDGVQNAILQINFVLSIIDLILSFVVTFFMIQKGDCGENKYGQPTA